MAIRWVCLGMMIGIALGCASSRPHSTELYNHVIEFDGDGFTIDPSNGKRLANAREQFSAILRRVQTDLHDRPNRRILMFIHGGLTTPDSALDRIECQLAQIKVADPDCYPIFVVWDSSLGSTYGEHLFDVREGQKDSRTIASGRRTFPIYFCCDVLRAAARAPVVWLEQRHTDDQAIVAGAQSILEHQLETQKNPEPEQVEAWTHDARNANAIAFYLELNHRYWDDRHAAADHARRQIAISIGNDESTSLNWLGRAGAYFVTLPSKMLTAPVIDALGTAAWRDMTRRTQTILEGASDFEVRPNTPAAEISEYLDRGTDGGLDQFVRLLAELPPPPDQHPYEITLVAHSMGSMIVNELLRRQTQREVEYQQANLPMHLAVKNIVYMAAACSIRDYTSGVVPFMRRPDHQDCQFYSLCLHPTAELIEANLGDIPPRGSLLCWIDQFLGEPATPLDRTLGRWDNLVQVAYVIPPNLRGRTTIKAFALRPGSVGNIDPSDPQPQRHTDFSQSPYWDPKFW
jgi:pimeloyl-ACP methyl ester carboxylesterase